MSTRAAVTVIGALIAALLAGCAGEMCLNFSDRYSGPILFRVHCASCHGENAHGDGPVAPLLTVKVPDLTRLSATHGGSFPEEEVFRIIDGQAEMPAHGTRHMPVWGYEFFGQEADDEEAHREATDRIESLVHYLRRIQLPAPTAESQ